MTGLPARQTPLAPDTPVDLDTCAREPIHIPGRVQPRGCLLALRASDLTVVQCSVNVVELLGRTSEQLLGTTLSEGLGPSFEATVRRHLDAGPRLHDRNPLLVTVDVGGEQRAMDAILHRTPLPGDRAEDSLVVVELEVAAGPRPFTFANTYQAVRDAVTELNRVSSLTEIFDIAARHVRDLTGFDRVMIYAFDEDYNGEVVAEVHRSGLNPFLGLHYPATDIPAQARALYEKNWIRLISDVGYVPSEIVPTANPLTGGPLDLTHATLRSVSPVHLEYLTNMGVRASMSISLLRDGRLWGLIACHHYSGPHEPAFGVRAAAEFLGSTLSLRLVAQVEEDRLAAAQRAAGMLADLVARSRDEDLPLAHALTATSSLLELTQADGVVVLAEDEIRAQGETPDEETCRRLAEWVLLQEDDLVRTDSIAAILPDLTTGAAAGLLGISLPDGQAVVWLRHEATRDVDWGGDPHNKTIERLEDESVRLSPRKSFERWREVVRDHSLPWQDEVVTSARALRGHLVEALYLRGQRDLRSAQAMQRSMLPVSLPQPAGWAVTARYEPADGGRVGGDWYDALVLPSGRLAAVVGDVAGHGHVAAASMGQLRNALRAILVGSESPSRSIAQLDVVARWTLPDQYATVLVAVLDLETGELEYASAGHLPPLLLAPDSTSTWDRPLGTAPLGVLDSTPATRRVTVPPGGGVALFSDGLVERRSETILRGVERLQAALADGAGVDGAMTLSHATDSVDDATLLMLCRTGP